MPLFEVRRGQSTGYGGQTAPGARLTTLGEMVAVDFITASLLDGRGYQDRAGTIATGLSAQNVIADTSADMCQDGATGTTIIPIKFHAAVRMVATALTFQAAVKSVGAVSTSGTAFVPLPLLTGGTASGQQARVAADAVVVPAELATTTKRLFEYENNYTQTPSTDTGGDLAGLTVAANALDLRDIGVGPYCVYVQVASTTAQNLWFGTLDFLQFPTAMIWPNNLAS